MIRQAPTNLEMDEFQDLPGDAQEAMAPADQFESFRTNLPTQAEIANRAYDIYIRTGRIDGRCEQNWHQAERELLAESLNRAAR